MERPPGHSLVCLLLLLAIVGGYFAYFPRTPKVECAAIASVLILGGIVLSFWEGSKVARWLLILAVAYTWLRLAALLLNPSLIDKIVIIVEAFLAVPMMFWLFNPRVVAFCNKSQQNESSDGDVMIHDDISD